MTARTARAGRRGPAWRPPRRTAGAPGGTAGGRPGSRRPGTPAASARSFHSPESALSTSSKPRSSRSAVSAPRSAGCSQARDLIPVSITRRRAGRASRSHRRHPMPPAHGRHSVVLAGTSYSHDLRSAAAPSTSRSARLGRPSAANARSSAAPSGQRRLASASPSRPSARSSRSSRRARDEDREGQLGADRPPRRAHPFHHQNIAVPVAAHPRTARPPSRTAGSCPAGRAAAAPAPTLQPGPEGDLVVPPVEQVVGVHDSPTPAPAARSAPASRPANVVLPAPPGRRPRPAAPPPAAPAAPSTARPAPQTSRPRRRSDRRRPSGRHRGGPRRDERQAGRGAVLDQAPERVGVEVLLDQVAEQVERRVPGRAANSVSGATVKPCRPASRAAAVQKRPAEPVRLERAVPVGTERRCPAPRPPVDRRVARSAARGPARATRTRGGSRTRRTGGPEARSR